MVTNGISQVAAISTDSELLRLWRFGVIETVDGKLVSIRRRRLPKLFTPLDACRLARRIYHRHTEDRCWLYYDQPWGHASFLVVKFLFSTRGARFATVNRALQTVDEIAQLKQADAILCEAFNRRISDRALARWGWEPHMPTSRRRHFIKRRLHSPRAYEYA